MDQMEKPIPVNVCWKWLIVRVKEVSRKLMMENAVSKTFLCFSLVANVWLYLLACRSRLLVISLVSKKIYTLNTDNVRFLILTCIHVNNCKWFFVVSIFLPVLSFRKTIRHFVFSTHINCMISCL